MDPLNGQIDPLSLSLENPLILLIKYQLILLINYGPLDGLMVSLNGQNACLVRQIDHQNDWKWLNCTTKWSDLTFLWVVRFTLFGKTGPFYDLMDPLGGLMDPLELWAVQCILLRAIRPSWLNYTEWPDGHTELPYEWQHVYWPFEWPDWPSESWFTLWVTKFTGLNSW